MSSFGNNVECLVEYVSFEFWSLPPTRSRPFSAEKTLSEFNDFDASDIKSCLFWSILEMHSIASSSYSGKRANKQDLEYLFLLYMNLNTYPNICFNNLITFCNMYVLISKTDSSKFTNFDWKLGQDASDLYKNIGPWNQDSQSSNWKAVSPLDI